MKQPKKRKMEDRFVESLLPENDVKVTQKIKRSMEVKWGPKVHLLIARW